MKHKLFILILSLYGSIAYAQNEIPLTFECLETPFHVDEIYQTTQMFCNDGKLTYGDDDPCSDIYYENGFGFFTARFKHENDPSPVGTFGDIFFDEDEEGVYVELLQARMFITTPDDEPVNNIILEIEDISQNGFVFGYNKPSQLVFYNSLEELDEAYPTIHWNGSQLLIDETVTEFQFGADHLIARNISANGSVQPTSIFNLQVEEKKFAFPNPVSDILSFELEKEVLADVELYDIHGMRVLQEKQVVNAKVLVASLYPGTYIAKATTPEGKIYIQKVTKL